MPDSEQNEQSGQLPLVVDVDGTLLRTDLLFESFWAALGRHPVATCKVVFKNLIHKARLKANLARLAQLDMAEMPLNPEVEKRIRDARQAERAVALASGSDQTLVRALADRLDLGEPVLASDGETNMTGNTKARALVARFGKAGFDYVGDSRADLPVWAESAGKIAVVRSARFRNALQSFDPPVEIIESRQRPKDSLRALRPHQWIKNILLFLPIVAAHRLELHSVLLTLWGIAVFSAAASSIYIINDLLDLSADRRHPTKCKRPFAAGAVPIQTGMVLFLLLASTALGGALLHSAGLCGIIAVYMVLSLSYSLVLKRLRWVDVATLAALYTLRVVAGAVVAGVPMSGWLGSFVFPVFLALGCVKRLIELSRASDDRQLPGRGYARHDRGDLRNIAITASVGALVVYLLYSYDSIALNLYKDVWLLRLAAVPVALWLARMIWRGWQGRMNYDPIVFALRDPVGLTLMAIGAGLTLAAASVI